MKPGNALLLVALAISLGACTSTTVDEYRENNTQLTLNKAERVVVLGRRHEGKYETEPDFIDCIGGKLGSAAAVAVVSEQSFIDSLYPWFEPRTAPLTLNRLQAMMNEPLLAERIHSQGIRYMIWVDGSTETTDKEGSLACGVGPGGGGCFGYATWDKNANYEAIIWDVDTFSENGRVKVDAKGTSYLFALGAPIPIIAQVKSEACEGIGRQLRSFFTNEITLPTR